MDGLAEVAKTWDNEVTTLKAMSELNSRHIVRFITAFTKGDLSTNRSYYLMLKWADGGNLEDFWAAFPEPVLSGELVKEAVAQFCGLAEALLAAHYQRTDSTGVRHGNLKPSNILRFLATQEKVFGTLKLGGWGLAKHHKTRTLFRAANTTTKYGTALYEPPEVSTGSKRILSRLYDVWSMGCVILELIIWLLYGYDELKRYRAEVGGLSMVAVGGYKLVEGGAVVHDVVERWMSHMANDRACAEGTALGELLRLVRTRLIVVALPPLMGETVYDRSNFSSSEADSLPKIRIVMQEPLDKAQLPPAQGIQTYRATSEELFRAMQDILDDEERPLDYSVSND
jgi:serine/threonine protein kinase